MQELWIVSCVGCFRDFVKITSDVLNVTAEKMEHRTAGELIEDPLYFFRDA